MSDERRSGRPIFRSTLRSQFLLIRPQLNFNVATGEGDLLLYQEAGQWFVQGVFD